MAVFDDRRFLLSHINHSFITGDDTGICEVVMLDEDVFENQHNSCLKLKGQNDENSQDRLDPKAYDLDYESELFESEQGQSYDIASDLDYICHRRRSNTAQRLDRLKKDRLKKSQTTTIVWRCSSPNSSQNEERLSQDSLNSTAENADSTKSDNGLPKNRTKSLPTKSGLTRLLEKFPSLPRNPFDEFAQFDGGMSEAKPVKKIMIFIAIPNIPQPQQKTHQEPDQSNDTEIDRRSSEPDAANSSKDGSEIHKIPQSKPKNDGPLEVVIVSNARVLDLIGLICWQYTNEGREPKLHHDINRYCLRIAEDNGEVDPDFSSLNPKEPLCKFNFPSLALMEKTEERVRSYNDTYPNGSTYSHRPPSIAHNVIASSTKISTTSSRFAALTRIIFRDDKLDTS